MSAQATGSYGTPTGTNASISADASQSVAAPTNGTVGPQPLYDPSDGTTRVVTSVYEWTWTPDGPLANDPAPPRDVNLSYNFTGGPVQAIIAGSGVVRSSGSFTAHHVDGQYDDQSWGFVGSTLMNNTYTPPTGTQSRIVGYTGQTNMAGSLVIVNGNTLRFNNQLLAVGYSRVSASNGGTAQSKFNAIQLNITAVALQ